MARVMTKESTEKDTGKAPESWVVKDRSYEPLSRSMPGMGMVAPPSTREAMAETESPPRIKALPNESNKRTENRAMAATVGLSKPAPEVTVLGGLAAAGMTVMVTAPWASSWPLTRTTREWGSAWNGCTTTWYAVPTRVTVTTGTEKPALSPATGGTEASTSCGDETGLLKASNKLTSAMVPTPAVKVGGQLEWSRRRTGCPTLNWTVHAGARNPVEWMA